MKKLFAFILIFSVGLALRAEPIEITRQQASDLFVALTKIEPGLGPDNVVVAADNINALKPIVEALDKGKVRVQRDTDMLPAGDDRAAKAWALHDKIEAKCDELIKVDITRIDITNDEIKAARISPRDLAPIRKFLKPKTKS